MWGTSVVLLLIAGALSSPALPPGLTPQELNEALHEAGAARSVRATANQRWIDIVEDYARSEMTSRGEHRAFRLDLPIKGHSETLPVLVLPVPVVSEQGSCGPNKEIRKNNRNRYYDDDDDDDDFSPRRPQKPRRPTYDEGPAYNERPTFEKTTTYNQRPIYDERPTYEKRPTYDERPTYEKRPTYDERPTYENRPTYDERPSYEKRPTYDERPSYEKRPTYEKRPSYETTYQNHNEQSARPAYRPSSQRDPPTTGPYTENRFSIEPRLPEPNTLPTVTSVSSEYLVDQFRAQTPSDPELPPALLPSSPGTRGVRSLVPAVLLPTPGPAPPRPAWDRSLFIRAELTVPRADYTEPYTMWWDASSGRSRVDFHDGSTSTVCQRTGANTYQRVEMRVDDSEGAAVRRCGVTPARAQVAADRAPPALPDLSAFQFSGFTNIDGRRDVEVWRMKVTGSPGEGGAARGESLTFHHELLLTRRQQGAVPLKYQVGVHSSVLGENCDGYEHRYEEVLHQEPDPALLQIDTAAACQVVEEMDPRDAEVTARLQPLREFTLPMRDLRYDQALQAFSIKFERKYIDNKEEAVRKNCLMQHSRFISAGNREGAPFEMAVNFLSDRLNAELQTLLGVVFEDEDLPAERFPHPTGELDRLDRELPDEFDWREKGGVTHVRYQGSCASCWAMAVTGAVEGALFKKTGTLVPLAEQCLVDCGHKYGANGCKGTWPSHAYDYVQELGLPSLADYGEHKDRVEKCRDQETSPVTLISAHVNVTRNSIPALKVAIRKHSPSVVIIDGYCQTFLFYKKGVLLDERCGKARPKLNHAVLAVGWGEREGAPHFIVKNSYSAAWGDGGYARLHAPTNTCGVLSLPSYPRLERDDVRKLPGGAAPGDRDV